MSSENKENNSEVTCIIYIIMSYLIIHFVFYIYLFIYIKKFHIKITCISLFKKYLALIAINKSFNTTMCNRNKNIQIY